MKDVQMDLKSIQGLGLVNKKQRFVKQSLWDSRVAAMAAIALLLMGSGCTAQRTSITVDSANGASASPAILALVDHLNLQGAKLYTTYWCPYCNRQQALFGSAVAKLQVVECDPQGENAQPEQCAQAQVSSYPTWQMNGQLYRGLQSLEELAVRSGYQGSQQFEK